MVPQTYPSVYNTYTNRTEMVVYELTSISGKVRWTDYIPVKMTTSTNAAKDNTTDSDGCIPISPLGSITNKQAFTDYIPIYVDNSATDAWAVSATGYIPYGISSAAIGILKRPGIEAHVYLPGIGTLSGLAAANFLDSALTTPATVDNPVGGVVDAVGVINATQPTTAAKPRLERGVRNLQLRSGDLSFWNSTNAGTITAGQADPNGGTTAYLFSGAGKNVYLTTSSPAGVGTMAFTLYSPTDGTIVLGGAGGAGFRDTVSVSAGWGTYVVNKTFNISDGCAMFLTGTLASIVFYRAGYFTGTLTAAQILAEGGIPLTTTAAASNPSAGKYSWAFDGGDSLALGSVPFQMADDHAVIVGARTDGVSAAKGDIYSQASTSAGNPLITLGVTSGGIPQAVWRDDAGVLVALTYGSSVVGVPTVTSLRKVGNTKILRINGVQRATNSTVLGAATFTSAAIGVRPIASPTNNHDGSTGPIIDIKGTLTDSEMLTLERLVANLTPNAPSF